MIFARSNRSLVMLGLASCLLTAVLASLAGLALLFGRAAVSAVLAMLGVVALAAVIRFGRRLRRWPLGRLAFFRDRLILLHGRTELQAQWDRIELASLADQTEWGSSRWPDVKLTDRLTLRVVRGGSFSFRPASFGLDPAACRDVILRLRDERQLRVSLPEFDSALDLIRGPVRTGELIHPQL